MPSGDPDQIVMTSTVAAEYLRTYARGGTDLDTCYRIARMVTFGGSEQDKVEAAAKALGLT